MNLGRYEIETYYVVVNGQTDSRQRIVYTGNNGEDIFIERYYGMIRDGYKGSNTYFKNLSHLDIKTHIAGESIVVNDKSDPPMPQIYLMISTIESIQRDGELRLIVVDNQIEPITLEFLTPFDCNQAYSNLSYVLENSDVDLGEIDMDTVPPVIFFNEFFFGETVKLDGSDKSGPFSTDDGAQFRVDIDLSKYEGPFPITKDYIIKGLVYVVKDDRDGEIPVTVDDISVYKNVFVNSNLVDDISDIGNYILKFQIHDLGQNQNNATVIFSITKNGVIDVKNEETKNSENDANQKIDYSVSDIASASSDDTANNI